RALARPAAKPCASRRRLREASLVLLFGVPVGGVEERRTLARREAPSWSDFAQLSERSGRRPRSEFCASAKVRAPQSSPRSGPTPSGSPFLGSFFWRDKRRNSPAGARPGLPPHSAALTIKHKSAGLLRKALRYLSANGVVCE